MRGIRLTTPRRSTYGKSARITAADLTERPGHARAVRPDLLESVTHPEYNRKRQPRAVVVDALEPGTEELIDLG
jgi:hypothetical protein